MATGWEDMEDADLPKANVKSKGGNQKVYFQPKPAPGPSKTAPKKPNNVPVVCLDSSDSEEEPVKTASKAKPAPAAPKPTSAAKFDVALSNSTSARSSSSSSSRSLTNSAPKRRKILEEDDEEELMAPKFAPKPKAAISLHLTEDGDEFATGTPKPEPKSTQAFKDDGMLGDWEDEPIVKAPPKPPPSSLQKRPTPKVESIYDDDDEFIQAPKPKVVKKPVKSEDDGLLEPKLRPNRSKAEAKSEDDALFESALKPTKAIKKEKKTSSRDSMDDDEDLEAPKKSKSETKRAGPKVESIYADDDEEFVQDRPIKMERPRTKSFSTSSSRSKVPEDKDLLDEDDFITLPKKMTKRLRKASDEADLDFDKESGGDEEMDEFLDVEALADEVEDLKPKRKLPSTFNKDTKKRQTKLIETGFSKASKNKKRKRDEYEDEIEDDDDGEFLKEPIMIDDSDDDGEGDSAYTLGTADIDENAEDMILSAPGVKPEAKVPAKLNAMLRDYQRQGVKFLYELYTQNKGGILADEMGLGKTIQAVSFFVAVLGVRKKGKDMFEKKSSKADKPKRKMILLTVPASVLENWRREIRQWTTLAGGAFEVEQYTGAHRSRIMERVKGGEVDVMMTTYNILRADMTIINELDWELCLFDEVHQIKGKRSKTTLACQTLRSAKRYGLTGTVMQNNWEEFYTLISFVQPGCLGTLREFNDAFATPIKLGHVRNASTRQLADKTRVIKVLNRLLKKIVIRRDKSLLKNILPPKSDQIVFCCPTMIQITAYQRALARPDINIIRKWGLKCECGSGKDFKACCAKEEIEMVVAERASRVDQLHTELKAEYEAGFKFTTKEKKKSDIAEDDVENYYMDLVDDDADDSDDSDTKKKKKKEKENAKDKEEKLEEVLFGAQNAPAGLQINKIIFPAMDCMAKIATHIALMKPKEGTMDFEALARRTDWWNSIAGDEKPRLTQMINEHSPELSGKLMILNRLLEAFYEQKKKVLVFSKHTTTLDIIQRAIPAQFGTKLSRLDGSTTIGERQKIIDLFNTAPYTKKFIFFLTTRAGGVGLNITAASVVVVFDPSWNVSHDLQAQDRIHRFGQKNKCEIYRLVTKSSIEEQVYRRQVYKQQMASMGLEANAERRYFDGVHGVKGQEGELFGLGNLLRNYSDKLMTVELIKEAERMYNQNTVPGDLSDLHTEAYNPSGADQEEQKAMNKALFNDEVKDNDPDLKTANPTIEELTTGGIVNLAGPDRLIQNILMSSNAVHHDNKTVVGHSEIESKITHQILAAKSGARSLQDLEKQADAAAEVFANQQQFHDPDAPPGSILPHTVLQAVQNGVSAIMNMNATQYRQNSIAAASLASGIIDMTALPPSPVAPPSRGPRPRATPTYHSPLSILPKVEPLPGSLGQLGHLAFLDGPSSVKLEPPIMRPPVLADSLPTGPVPRTTSTASFNPAAPRPFQLAQPTVKEEKHRDDQALREQYRQREREQYLREAGVAVPEVSRPRQAAAASAPARPQEEFDNTGFTFDEQEKAEQIRAYQQFAQIRASRELSAGSMAVDLESKANESLDVSSLESDAQITGSQQSLLEQFEKKKKQEEEDLAAAQALANDESPVAATRARPRTTGAGVGPQKPVLVPGGNASNAVEVISDDMQTEDESFRVVQRNDSSSDQGSADSQDQMDTSD